MKVGIKLEFEPEVLKRLAAKAKSEKITPVELMKEQIYKAIRPRVEKKEVPKYADGFFKPSFLRYLREEWSERDFSHVYLRLIRKWYDKDFIPGMPIGRTWPDLPAGYSHYVLCRVCYVKPQTMKTDIHIKEKGGANA